MSENPDHDPASEAVAGQIQILADRLLAHIGDAIHDVPDDAIDSGHDIDEQTGELLVSITIGDYTYHEAGDDLIVQTERAGRMEWTRVRDDGTLEPWQVAAPPRSLAASN